MSPIGRPEDCAVRILKAGPAFRCVAEKVGGSSQPFQQFGSLRRAVELNQGRMFTLIAACSPGRCSVLTSAMVSQPVPNLLRQRANRGNLLTAKAATVAQRCQLEPRAGFRLCDHPATLNLCVAALCRAVKSRASPRTAFASRHNASSRRKAADSRRPRPPPSA